MERVVPVHVTMFAPDVAGNIVWPLLHVTVYVAPLAMAVLGETTPSSTSGVLHAEGLVVSVSRCYSSVLKHAPITHISDT